MNSIYLPPICALGTIIFFGWVMPEEDVKDELSNHGTLRIGYYKLFRILSRYVAPFALLVVLITGIIS
jgi:SNF family Na+-dependent transporter